MQKNCLKFLLFLLRFYSSFCLRTFCVYFCFHFVCTEYESVTIFAYAPPHSGPGGRRINFWKCTKKEAKRGNKTLNIVFPKTGLFCLWKVKKNDFWPFSHFGLEKVTLGYWDRKTGRRAAKRPPTGKPKVSRVTSGYVGDMFLLSRTPWAQIKVVIWV